MTPEETNHYLTNLARLAGKKYKICKHCRRELPCLCKVPQPGEARHDKENNQG